jgi:uncharacterized protein (DUF433 family)
MQRKCHDDMTMFRNQVRRIFLLEVHGRVKKYVEYRDDGYWITGTRVSLDSVVYAYLEGLSPESIAESFDTLTLEEVYGALAFYLGHRDTIDTYLRQSEAKFDPLYRRTRSPGANPAWAGPRALPCTGSLSLIRGPALYAGMPHRGSCGQRDTCSARVRGVEQNRAGSCCGGCMPVHARHFLP